MRPETCDLCYVKIQPRWVQLEQEAQYSRRRSNDLLAEAIRLEAWANQAEQQAAQLRP